MTDVKLNCNFCGKGRDQVEKLIAGPNVYICNECISISYDILDDDKFLLADTANLEIPSPREIHDFLNMYIMGQEETKEILSTSAYNHYKRINHKSTNDIVVEKSNVLMIGPTGSGKTLFAKTLAKKLKVPFAIADATTLTEAGYVGDDVEAVLERLLAVADYDIKLAQQGIIFIDEIDKKSRKSESSTTRDVSGEGVQQAMLRLIEGTVTKVKLGTKKLTDEYVEFDTSNILFIVGGAFVGIEEYINKRLKSKTGVGFTGNVLSREESKNILKLLQAPDVVKYGLIPELVGRLPIITTLDKLSEEQLVEIMSKAKNNVIDQVKELMYFNEIELEFSNSYFREVARLSVKTGMGARAVKSIVENSLFYLMYNAPELQKDNVIKVIFDKYPSRIDKPIAIYEDGKSAVLDNYRFFRDNSIDTLN